jgi:uncharacterized DUF497 family protein
MKFEWDEKKNESNIEKHGISFEQAMSIFDGFTFDSIDESCAYDEIREISIGKMDGNVILVVVHTDRDGVCRIISARPALKKEKKRYDKEIQKAFDA